MPGFLQFCCEYVYSLEVIHDDLGNRFWFLMLQVSHDLTCLVWSVVYCSHFALCHARAGSRTAANWTASALAHCINPPSFSNLYPDLSLSSSDLSGWQEELLYGSGLQGPAHFSESFSSHLTFSELETAIIIKGRSNFFPVLLVRSKPLVKVVSFSVRQSINLSLSIVIN